MKRLFGVFIREVIFDGEWFLIVMKTTDEPLESEKEQKEEATRKKFELLRFGDTQVNKANIVVLTEKCFGFVVWLN